MHRLYFALHPDAEAAEAIAALTGDLRRRWGLAGWPVPPDRLHISLNFVGKSTAPPPVEVIAQASAVASTVRGRPFAVGLDRVASFRGDPGRRPLVLLSDDGVVGVHALHATLHKALADAHMRPRKEPVIVPHLTLLRDPAEAPETFVDPVQWMVREFVLIHSVQGQGRHNVMGRWTLEP